MPHLHLVKDSKLQQGCVNVVSMHTTTAITINEWESRLVRDVRAWLLEALRRTTIVYWYRSEYLL